MFLISFILILSVSLYAVAVQRPGLPEHKPEYECAACTFGMSLLLQLSQVHNESISAQFEKVCQLFSNPAYKSSCDVLISFIGQLAIKLMEENIPPDVLCTSLRVCPKEPSQKRPACYLYPMSEPQSEQILAKAELIVSKHMSMQNWEQIPPFCDWPGLSYMCKLIESIFSRITPTVDIDGDGFSSAETLRGYAWRGRDCNELDSSHYPGRRPIDDDREYDSNCNGIYGVDRKTGIPFEKLFCEGSKQHGMILLGDSAGAHFHIPDEWLYPPRITKGSLSHLPFVLENEFDWPMLSASTGYRNITWSIVEDNTVSVYQMMRDRNLCNHRDYQNLGVNGADSFAAVENLKSMRRNSSTDHPVNFVYEFVGNDVCNFYNDTIAAMTTVGEIKKNVRKLLDSLDESLPKGSHVLLMGLADGRILYESLYNRYHPLGRLNKNIKYPQFYDYLTCVQVNPCNGWMSSNATLRDLTSKRAWELSKAIKDVALERKYKYNGIDVNYVDCPLNKIFLDWEEKHGPHTAYQLIETVDGFHPNKKTNILFAQYMWSYVRDNLPEYIGEVNPYNDQIRATFGDLGGH